MEKVEFFIPYDTPDNYGNVIKKGAFKNLDELAISGKIISYHEQEDGVRIIKEFKIESASIILDKP